MREQSGSVEEALAQTTAAEAGQLLVLDRELVVVGDLFSRNDVSLRVDDDFLRAVHQDHLGSAVRLNNERAKINILKPNTNLMIQTIKQIKNQMI